MGKSTSNTISERCPPEQILLDKWNEYWNPAKEEAINRLVERVQFYTIYKAQRDMGGDPKVISKDLIRSVPGFKDFPEKIPAWVELLQNNNKETHYEKKIDFRNEFHLIFSKRKIGRLYRKYYANFFKSKLTTWLFGISFAMFLFLCGIIIFLFFLTKYEFLENNMNFLYYVVAFIVYAVGSLILMYYYVGSQVRPSKWHWFDVILLILLPLLIYFYDLNTGFIILQLFAEEQLSNEIITIMMFFNSLSLVIFIFLAFFATAYSIIPCTPKGQLFYSLLNFQMAAKLGSRSNIKMIIKYLHLLVISLNDMLMEYFNLTIDNQNEIQECFNKKLLEEGIEFLLKIDFFEANDILNYFSKATYLPNIQQKKKKRLSKHEKNKKKNEEYIDTLNSVNKIVEKIEFIGVKPNLVRITFKEKVKKKFQKIITSIAALSTIITAIIPTLLSLF